MSKIRNNIGFDADLNLSPAVQSLGDQPRGDTTRALRLTEGSLYKWVKYDRSSKEDLMETVLEQYLRVHYPEVKTFVKEHNPATVAEAAILVENFGAAHRGPRSNHYAGKAKPAVSPLVLEEELILKLPLATKHTALSLRLWQAPRHIMF